MLYSRLGDRLIPLTPFVLLALIFLWHGFTRSRWRDFIASGVLFGLSAYTYSATRMLPVVFGVFVIYLAIFNRPFLRKHGVTFRVDLLTAALIVLPMVIHIAAVPVAERRLGEVAGPLDALAQGDVRPLINSTLITAGMFIATGDPEWLYNIPNRPVFDLLTGAIFFIAVILSLRRAATAGLCVRAHLVGCRTAARHVDVARRQQQSQFSGANAGFLVGCDRHRSPLATRWPKYGSAFMRSGADRVLSPFRFTITLSAGLTDDDGAPSNIKPTSSLSPRQIEQLPSDKPLVFSSGDVMHWNPWSVTVFRLTAPIGYTQTRWFDARSSFHLSARPNRSHVDQRRDWMTNRRRSTTA